MLTRSPGRINLIGEHTDYNEGYVLPAAIDKYVYIAGASNGSRHIRLHSIEFNERVEVSVDGINRIGRSWANYIIGVVAELQKAGYTIGGFDLLVDGDLPIGAGLSSSAAIACATAEALNTIFSLELDRSAMIHFAQAAEHNYAGVLCGIMDQFASVQAKKHHALLLDCRTLKHEQVPLALDGYRIVLLNTNVKHSLASSAYNTRREECETGVSMIQRHLPNVTSLRDATFNMLVEFVHDPLIFSRCKYVIEENRRVLRAAEFLKRGNIIGLGEQMFRSHEGLANEYDVSCTELDWLINAVRYRPEVVGARMMGGGFGGCTINIIREEAVEKIVSELQMKYAEAMNKELTPYIVNTANGTGLLTPALAVSK